MSHHRDHDQDSTMDDISTPDPDLAASSPDDLDDLDDLEEEDIHEGRSTPSGPRTPPLHLASSASRRTINTGENNTQQTIMSAAELSPPDSQPRLRGVGVGRSGGGHHPLLGSGGAGSSGGMASASTSLVGVLDGDSDTFVSNGTLRHDTSGSTFSVHHDRDILETKGRSGGPDGEGEGKEKKGPGSTWKTKKGHEEMTRAMEALVDRYMIGRSYGDPLDPSKDERLERLYNTMKTERARQQQQASMS